MPAFFTPLRRLKLWMACAHSPILLLGKDTIGIHQLPLCASMNWISSITMHSEQRDWLMKRGRGSVTLSHIFVWILKQKLVVAL